MPQLIVCVTVDWEGENLNKENLDSMKKFRNEFPNIHLTHFICPAYLTRGNSTDLAVKEIKEAINKGDEVGLHVHAWESLVRAAGVVPRSNFSTYLDGYGPRVIYEMYKDSPADSGHGVPLGVYDLEEIVKIINCSERLLEDHELSRPGKMGFRCGGWLACDSVMKALNEARMLYDSSATDYSLFLEESKEILDAGGSNLGYWIVKLWGPKPLRDKSPIFLQGELALKGKKEGIDGKTQPYMLDVNGLDPIIEIPDNAALIDYINKGKMINRLNAALDRAQTGNGDVVLVCGFHQESAAKYLPTLSNALKVLPKDDRVAFKTMKTVVSLFNQGKLRVN